MYARRTDGNQQLIIDTLRSHGVSVACLSGCGGGVPDILAGYNQVNFLLEIKNENGRGSRMTPAEERFHREWKGECHVVFSAEDALSILGIKAGDE